MKHLYHALALIGASLLPAYAQDHATPKAYVVSDAHLDTQWNWDVQTTIRDFIPKTIRQNLLLLREYPDYIFNFEGGVKYAWMKEYYPHEFELVKKHIKDGRWHISGASWDANDVIVPSVESQIRNIMLGQNFYRDEFGVESTDIFLPDCFGFGWTLPTIASHCGLIGFSSQKLQWRTNPFYGNKKLPFNLGLWQGVDGSRIMMAHGFDYNHRWNGEDLSNDSTLIALAAEPPVIGRANQPLLNTVYRYYGTGDTGGSPTIASVAAVEKGVNGNGPLKVISAASDQVYKDYLPYESHPELPIFDGELLIDVHSTGCYTSEAAMKLYNRQNEQLGDAAERAAVMAAIYAGSEYPTKDFTENWRRFIWHQFHDDLTGTSIPRAYEFSWNDELLTLKQFANLMNHAASQVAAGMDTRTKGEAIVLYNPLAEEVTDVVELLIPAKQCPAKVTAKDNTGKTVAAQIGGYDGKNVRVLIEATLPPVSFAVYDVALNGKGGAKSMDKAVNTFENSVYKLTFDHAGDITSLVDKRNGKELVKGGRKIRLALFPENVSTAWPAWEIKKNTIDAEPVSIVDDVTVSLVEDGPLRKTVKVAKKYGDSEFVQYITLFEGAKADQIDFNNRIEWATTNALLKAEFPLSVSNEKAVYDLGIGVVERGNNKLTAYEVPAQQWADLSDRSGDYGLTVINDSKYGWDKPDDNTLRLTLLHTPKTDRGYTYQDHQDWGHHDFTYSLIPHAGGLDRVVATSKAARLNQKIKAYVADKHKGNGRLISFVKTDNPNVAIKALKGAEDGDGYIVRLYETAGKAGSTNVVFDRPVTAAILTDGTEKNLKPLAMNGNSVNVDLKANGLQTFRVRFADNDPGAKITQTPVELAYDKKGMTWNEFRHNGDFSQGYTYAAELVPEKIIYNGIEFRLSPRKENNTLSSKGQTVALPEGKNRKLHVLASAAKEEGNTEALFNFGKHDAVVTVPSYTGFIGQWGHDGHTEGYLQPQDVAFVGTHRHSSMDDEPYEYTYMYHFEMEVPDGVESVVLPDNPELAIFSMTVSEDNSPALTPAGTWFKTANRAGGNMKAEETFAGVNILTPEMITGCSGFVVDSERPQFLVDGDATTKWCDVAGVPSWVAFDMQTPRVIKGWKMVNAAEENPEYVTSVCYLQGRDSDNDEWHTIDCVRGNRANVMKRSVTDARPVRQLRLMVTSPMQDPTAGITRIYELEVFE